MFDKYDQNYTMAFPFWNRAAGKVGTLYTSDYVLDETLALLNVRISHAAAVEFGHIILASKVINIIPITSSRWDGAWESFKKYSDKDFSFTDCISFIIMRVLNLVEAFTFDKQFQQMGFTMIPD